MSLIFSIPTLSIEVSQSPLKYKLTLLKIDSNLDYRFLINKSSNTFLLPKRQTRLTINNNKIVIFIKSIKHISTICVNKQMFLIEE